MPTKTRKIKGRVLLSRYIKTQMRTPPPGFKFSFMAFAAALGVTRQALRDWTLGVSIPSAPARSRISIATYGEVPPASWL